MDATPHTTGETVPRGYVTGTPPNRIATNSNASGEDSVLAGHFHTSLALTTLDSNASGEDSVLAGHFHTSLTRVPVPPHAAEDRQQGVERHQTLTLDEFLLAELRDPGVRAEYEEGKRQVELSVQALRLRLARGMTQQQVAEAMGTKQSAISRFERGEASPTARFLEKLAHALGAELIQAFREPGPTRDDIIEATCGMLAHLGPMTPALLKERRRDLEREERKAGCPPRKT